MVKELPHILYHTKKNNSRIYKLPNEPQFNPRDYRVGNFIVYSTGKSLACRTKFNITTGVNRILQHFEHVHFSIQSLGVSILYNDLFLNVGQERCLNLLLDVGFQKENIYLISQSECAFMFPTVESIGEVLIPYNVEWSTYMQEHCLYIEQHLRNIVLYTSQQSEKDKAQLYLNLIHKSRTLPDSFLPHLGQI